MMDAVIFGRKKQGKSTISLFFAISQRPKQIVIWDPCAQYTVFPTAHDPKRLKQLIDYTEFGGDYFNIVVYQPAMGKPKEAFPAFARIVWESKRRPMFVIVDEASRLQSGNWTQEDLDLLMRQGHRYGITLVLSTHRPRDVDRTIWGLSSIYIFFRTSDKRDIERIAEASNDEVAEKVRQLGRFQAVVWNEDEQSYQVWTEPEKWYVDIHGEHEPNREEQTHPPNLSSEEMEEAYAS